MAVYDAFISYSHAKDRPIAAALQSVIQKLGKPWYRRRALRVFRDDTSLSATPHLWPTIEQALGQSRFFILLASAEAAASKWVNKEVAFWLEHNSIDTLLIGLTDGQLAWDDAAGDFIRGDLTPLPPVLAGRFTSEPKWVDLRAYREGANARDARLVELGANFAAAIRGMPKEDLLSQEVRQQRRALTLSWSAAGSLLVLAGLAAWQWREALAQRDRAERTLAQATETANGLIYDLAERFRDAGLPAELVRDVLDSARALQEQLIDAGQVTPALRQSEGIALMATVRTLLTIGDTAGAFSAAERARRIFEGLVAGGADAAGDGQRNLAVAYGRIGDVLRTQGKLAEALQSYRAAAGMLERLAASDRSNAAWQGDLAVAYGRIGGVLKEQGKLEEALKSYRDSLAIRERLAAADRGSTAWQHLAVAHAGIGDVLAAVAVSYSKSGDRKGMQDKLEEALASFRESLAIMARLAASERGNTAWQRDLAVAHNKVGDVLGAQGKLEESLASFRDGLAIMERLAASDRGNAAWQYDLAMAYGHIGDLLREQGRFDGPRKSLADLVEAPRKLEEALKSYQAGLAILQRLAASDRGNATWQDSLAEAYGKVGDVLAAQGKLDQALASFRAGVDIRKQLAAADRSNPDRQRDLQFTAGRIGGLALRFLLAKDFARALETADQAISLAPDQLWLHAGRAHALMLLDRTDEARSLYLQHRGKTKVRGDKSWEAVILEGFGELRRAGLERPLMGEIDSKFAARG